MSPRLVGSRKIISVPFPRFGEATHSLGGILVVLGCSVMEGRGRFMPFSSAQQDAHIILRLLELGPLPQNGGKSTFKLSPAPCNGRPLRVLVPSALHHRRKLVMFASEHKRERAFGVPHNEGRRPSTGRRR